MGMSSLVFAFKQLFPRSVPGLFDNFYRFLYCDLGQCRPTCIFRKQSGPGAVKYGRGDASVPSTTDETRCLLSALLRPADLDPHTLSTLLDVRRV